MKKTLKVLLLWIKTFQIHCSEYYFKTYLIMNAAATFLTLGHLRSATTVRRLPRRPTTIMIPVTTAANVRRVGENLEQWVRFSYESFSIKTLQFGWIVMLNLGCCICWYKKTSTQFSLKSESVLVLLAYSVWDMEKSADLCDYHIEIYSFLAK